MTDYTWSNDSNRYRDVSTGRFVSRQTVLETIERSITYSTDMSQELASAVTSQSLSVPDTESLVRQELKKAYIRQYMLGKGGGVDNMTPKDWGSIGGSLKEQYGYLSNFMSEIANGNLTEAQIKMRLDMYFNSSREASSRGYMASFGLSALPAHPGDGSTICLTRCQCKWKIERVYDSSGFAVGWNCFWQLSNVQNCPTCVARSQAWNPLFIASGVAPTFEDAEDLFRQYLDRLLEHH